MAQTILVAEDQQTIRSLIEYKLRNSGYTVVSVADGAAALKKAVELKPDLVLLDVMMPLMTGFEVLAALKQNEETKRIPVLLVTAQSKEDEVLKGLELGADDYVTKPFNPRELIYRVKAILKRTQNREADSSAVISFDGGALIIDERRYEIKKRGLPVNLTSTEFKVFLTLASAPHKVFTRETLIENAFGHQFEGYDRSIDVHIKNIRRKLEDDPRNPTFILTVYKVGYKFIGERDA